MKELSQEHRLLICEKLVVGKKFFEIEEHYLCNTLEDLKYYFKIMCDRKEEGLVVKLPENKYEYGSRKNWFKIKPICESTFKVVDYEYGAGKLNNLVGALYIVDGNNKIKSKVGSGITDETREIIMNKLKDNTLIGSYIDVIYNEITDTNSLRFPRFSKFREDKDVADYL